MKKAAKAKDISVNVLQIEKGLVTFYIRGSTPIILHTFSDKSRWELLMPRVRTKGSKLQSLKHDPLSEYRESPYKAADSDPYPTRLLVPGTMIKAALTDVALDMPDTAKAVVGRMAFVEDSWIPLFGVPKIVMSMVRMADINKTPDVRTRAIVPEWALKVRVRYTKPFLTETAVANLLAAAGVMRGIGDWRPQKGKGDYGQFDLVDSRDKDWLRIVKEGARKVQDAALLDPQPYDNQTARDLAYFNEEIARRGLERVGDNQIVPAETRDVA